MRARRSIDPRKEYALRSTRYESTSPLGFVARGLLKAVLAGKNRTQATRWQEVVERAQEIQTKQDVVDRPVDEGLLFRGINKRLFDKDRVRKKGNNTAWN
jgi:hypothetical protein